MRISLVAVFMEEYITRAAALPLLSLASLRTIKAMPWPLWYIHFIVLGSAADNKFPYTHDQWYPHGYIYHSPPPFHCVVYWVLPTCRLQWIVDAAVNAALFMCVVVYLNKFYGGYEVVWWILLNAIYLLGPNNSEQWTRWIQARDMSERRRERKTMEDNRAVTHSELSVSNDNTPSFIRHYQ